MYKVIIEAVKRNNKYLKTSNEEFQSRQKKINTELTERQRRFQENKKSAYKLVFSYARQHAIESLQVWPAWPLKYADDTCQSYFTGEPNLPEGVDYPTDTNGKRLRFLLQVNLEEFPKFLERNSLPQSGMLYFFCGHENDAYFEQPNDPSQYRIIYHPSVKKGYSLRSGYAMKAKLVLNIGTEFAAPDYYNDDLKQRFNAQFSPDLNIIGHKIDDVEFMRAFSNVLYSYRDHIINSKNGDWDSLENS
ncbi:MAG: DUF1963 domain-containing protein, partial [Pseudomonadota bacterium]